MEIYVLQNWRLSKFLKFIDEFILQYHPQTEASEYNNTKTIAEYVLWLRHLFKITNKDLMFTEGSAWFTPNFLSLFVTTILFHMPFFVSTMIMSTRYIYLFDQKSIFWLNRKGIDGSYIQLSWELQFFLPWYTPSFVILSKNLKLKLLGLPLKCYYTSVPLFKKVTLKNGSAH